MKVERRALTSITPYDRNPRKNDAAVEVVAKSLKEFGFRQPIVVDAAGVIVVGHTRYKAALKLGLAEVPVHVADGLTAAQVKAYRIADNKTNELADWDFDLLPSELKGIEDDGFVVDWSQLGFDADELDRITGEATSAATNQIGALEYRVIVECADEKDQTNLIEALESEGRVCKALIS